MTRKESLKTIGTVTTVAAIIAVALLNASTPIKADDSKRLDDSEEARIHRGFAIAPVSLNLKNKNPDLVGLGSYLVNGAMDCNGCHSAGPATEYVVPTGNPYFLSPPFTGKQQVNSATYLGGGRDFGPYPGSSLPSIPHLYSRNLTRDYTGLPAGGRTFEQFRDIMRHGTDFDHIHPSCTATPDDQDNCLMAPFNGDLLQVMPWPVYQNLTQRDLQAIYEYLKAIPCNPGPNIDGAPYLQNTCN